MLWFESSHGNSTETIVALILILMNHLVKLLRGIPNGTMSWICLIFKVSIPAIRLTASLKLF